MKLKIYLALFFLISFSSIQSVSAQKSKIIGKWNPDMEVMKPVLMAAIEKEMGNMEDEAQKEMAKGMIEMMLGAFAEMSMEFKADGTYQTKTKNPMTNEEDGETGTWSYADGYIITKEDGDGKEDKVKVKEISATKLVIIPEDEPDSPFKEFVMKRSK